MSYTKYNSASYIHITVLTVFRQQSDGAGYWYVMVDGATCSGYEGDMVRYLSTGYSFQMRNSGKCTSSGKDRWGLKGLRV